MHDAGTHDADMHEAATLTTVTHCAGTVWQGRLRARVGQGRPDGGRCRHLRRVGLGRVWGVGMVWVPTPLVRARAVQGGWR